MSNIKNTNKITEKTNQNINIKNKSYVNAIRITPNKTDVIMDFAFIPSNIGEIKDPESIKVLDRIIVTHGFAKRISRYINETLEKYNKINKK